MIVCPSLWARNIDEIVMSPPVVSSAMVTRSFPALLTMITAKAEAVCALRTLVTKLQSPRSIRAMELAKNPAEKDSHPSVTMPTPSLARRIVPLIPNMLTAGPNSADDPK